ncbi:MAG: hypothetical protein ACOYOL_09125, partial [Chthoniobacterales bacterium]
MRGKQIALGAIGLAGGLVALVLAAWFLWWAVGSWKLWRAQADIRAAGLPTTAAEILPAPVSEADNAAALLIRAQALVKLLDRREGSLRPCPGSGRAETDPALFDEARMAELRTQMAWPETQEMLEALRTAAEKPAARFARDYTKGSAIDLVVAAGPLPGSRWLGTAAWLKARDGDASGAAADLFACARLASFSLDDMFLVTWLVGKSVDVMSATMTGSVLAALPSGTFQQADWQPLFDLWAAHAGSARLSLARALDGERIFFGSPGFEQLGGRGLRPGEGSAWPRLEPDGDEPALPWLIVPYVLPFNGLVSADHAAYLQLMLNVSERIAAFQPGDPDNDRLAETIPLTAFLTRLTAPKLDRVFAPLSEYIVQMQLAAVGLALEEFRARNGAYPESLDELRLPPGAVTDPFAGQPFRYQPTKTSVLVYSVGKDGIDNGG